MRLLFNLGLIMTKLSTFRVSSMVRSLTPSFFASMVVCLGFMGRFAFRF